MSASRAGCHFAPKEKRGWILEQRVLMRSSLSTQTAPRRGDGERDRVSGWGGFSAKSVTTGGSVWRGYCDRLHRDMIAEWCGGRKFRRALKTDLFDEAVGEGCFGALAAVAAEVEGIDVSVPLVEKVCRERKGFSVGVGDVRHLEFPDDSFDLVFSNSTLDHFETEAEIEESVSEFARILEVGGCLLITLDNPVNPVVGVRNFLPQRATGAIGLVPYFMGRTLPMRRLAELLERSGFRVQHRRHTAHAPRVAALHLCRLLEKSKAAGMMLSAMLAMEALAKLPTAPLTGYYSALLAVKRTGRADDFDHSSRPTKVGTPGNSDG